MALGQLVAHSLTGKRCWTSLSELHLREAPPVCRNTSLPALSFSKRLLKKSPEHKCPNPSILSLLSQQAAVPIPPAE